MLVGPGIKPGYEAAGVYTLEDIASTCEFMMDFDNPYQAGEPIVEAMELESASTTAAAHHQQALRLELQGPNPFVTQTHLRCCLADAVPAEISVHDVTGALICSHPVRAPGPACWTFVWDGTDGYARRVRCGLYYIRLQAGDAVRTRQVAMLR
jgi:hypothetical protein